MTQCNYGISYIRATLIIIPVLLCFTVFAFAQTDAQLEREVIRDYVRGMLIQPTGAEQHIIDQFIAATNSKPHSRDFLTPQATDVVKFSEGFEGEEFPPEGWESYNYAGDEEWFRYTGIVRSGEAAAAHWWDEPFQDGWLVTPAIQADTGDVLLFYEWTHFADWYGYNGLWISDGSPDPADGDFVEIAEIDDGDALWTQRMFPLDEYAGLDIYIAFVYQGADAHIWIIDDVMVIPGDIPLLAAAPDTLKVDLSVDMTAVDTMFIFNEGLTVLEFELTSRGTGVAVFPEEEENDAAKIALANNTRIDVQSSDPLADLLALDPNPTQSGSRDISLQGFLLENNEETASVHHDGDNSTRIGLMDAGTYTVASRFNAAEMGEYYTSDLLHIEYYVGDYLPYIDSFELKIWEGGDANNPGALIYQAEVSDDLQGGAWNVYELSAPIHLYWGTEYRIGYTVTVNSMAFPTGVDAGPMVAGKGGWIGFGAEPTTWYQLEPNYGIDRNINIRAVVNPAMPWITFSLVADTVSSGEFIDVEVTFDRTGLVLEPGLYYFNILIKSNDPITPEYYMPVEVTLLFDEEEGGEGDIVAGVDDGGSVPEKYVLLQNYPNPFNPSTTIQFELPVQSTVKIEIFNTIGQRVETLVNNQLDAGLHRIEWTPINLQSGVFFYRLEAIPVKNPSDRFVEVRRMVLVK